MQENNGHEKTKLIFKISGFILLILGLIFVIIAFVDFFSHISLDSGMPERFYFFFIGFPLAAIGGTLLIKGFRREIVRYEYNETIGTIKEGYDYITDKKQTGICPQCKNVNNADAAFCDKCGASLNKPCPYCNANNDSNAQFCNKCGNRL